MDECDVCFTGSGIITVTFDVGHRPPLDVRFCQACFDAIVVTMSERFVEAAKEADAAIADVKKMLGIE